MTKFDPALQAQVDAQLMEQGAYTALELLISSGRLIYSDYESWRRLEIELLEDVLMGSSEKIRAQIEQAAGYARSIGLVEQAQEFHAWQRQTRNDGDKPLRISADQQLHRLIAARYVPAQNVPQMDLFFDNPIVALTNGIVRALSARNLADAERQLDRLYSQAPNHPDLAAFDRLTAALARLDRPGEDEAPQLDFLLEVTPVAKRLLASQARDLLAPLWRRLADTLIEQPFSPGRPMQHRSFALSQAQDWAAVSECVRAEPQWWQHTALCLLLAQSGFYRQQRIETLTAWFHLCFQHPAQAAEVLDKRQQPDAVIAALWLRFLDIEDERESAETEGGAPLSAADFPAWMLLHEPGLAQQLAEDLPPGNSSGEARYRYVHQWIHARRANRTSEEMSLRKTLQGSHPALFGYLKRRMPGQEAG